MIGSRSSTTSGAISRPNATVWVPTSSMPMAARVASTLRSMYGASRSSWLGRTISDCTIAGYTRPPTINTTNHRPEATSGSRHRSVRIVVRYSTAVNSAIEHEQHHRRKLCLDHRVRGTLHEPAAFVGEFVPGEPVVGGLDGREHRQQHGGVHLGRGPNRRHRRREQHAAVEQMGGDREQQHDHERGEQPVDRERDERQLEHVEADVDAELCIVDTEPLAVAEQQPLLPLARPPAAPA